MGSPVPDAKERFLTVPMIAALAVCAILLAVPYLAFPEFGSTGNESSIQWLVSSWNKQTDYEHGWLVVPIIAFMLYHARKKIAQAPRRMDWRGLILFIPAALLLALSFRVGQPPRGRGRASPDPAGRSLVPGRTADRQAVRLPPALLLAVHSPSLFPAGYGGAANRRHGAGAPGCGPFRRGYLPARHQHPLHRAATGTPSTSQGGAAACVP